MSGYELFDGLNARSHEFRGHFRKLCYTCWMCYKPDTDPGLLLTNQRSTKSDNNDTYHNEPSYEDSSSISDNDDFYYEDSDDNGVKQRKEVTKERKRRLYPKGWCDYYI